MITLEDRAIRARLPDPPPPPPCVVPLGGDEPPESEGRWRQGQGLDVPLTAAATTIDHAADLLALDLRSGNDEPLAPRRS